MQPLKGSWWNRDHRDPPAAPGGPHAGAVEVCEESSPLGGMSSRDNI